MNTIKIYKKHIIKNSSYKIIGLFLIIFSFSCMAIQYIGFEKLCITDELTNNRTCYYTNNTFNLTGDSIIELNPSTFEPSTESAINWIYVIESIFGIFILLLLLVMGLKWLMEYF